MGHTVNEIDINFKNAMKRADELREIADGLKRLTNHNLDETFQRLSEYWTGINSASYLKKGHMLEEEISITADRIAQTADVLRDSAGRIYSAEKKALEIIDT